MKPCPSSANMAVWTEPPSTTAMSYHTQPIHWWQRHSSYLDTQQDAKSSETFPASLRLCSLWKGAPDAPVLGEELAQVGRARHLGGVAARQGSPESGDGAGEDGLWAQCSSQQLLQPPAAGWAGSPGLAWLQEPEGRSDGQCQSWLHF